MSGPVYNVNVYRQGKSNPTIDNADGIRSNVGVCFSGGGSRALTCAWRQMIGLRQLSGGGDATLLDKVRYISSVSGGSWAAVLYTYLPDAIPEDRFFPTYYPPAQLRLGSAPAGAMDVAVMDDQAMGIVPQQFANLRERFSRNIIVDFIGILLWKRLSLKESLKWLWMYVVGRNVLEPFGLYDYDFSLFGKDTPWHYDGAKYFSLTLPYAKEHIFDKPRHPSPEDFHFVRSDDGRSSRPMLIVNTNIIGKDCPGAEMMAPIQVPIQVTPVSGGSLGANPCVPDDIVGGGSVESFGFTSKLESASDDEATAAFPRTYSLVDVAACSSAFYASTLAENLRGVLDALIGAKNDEMEGVFGKILSIARWLPCLRLRKRLAALVDESRGLEFDDLVPEYNYWPVALSSQGASANRPTHFTDGGNLENLGVIGMLAQTNVDSLIVFVNTSWVLKKYDDVIVAAAQAAPLFGIAYDNDSHKFQPFEQGGVNPFTNEVDPRGFLQVFDNSNGEFDSLREGMYQANGSGQQSGPAFFKQSLTVVENKLAGVSLRDKPVTVLWVQNTRVNDWQEEIQDQTLADAIAKGQAEGDKTEFAGFPNYSTFDKIHATAAETNTLAQMWAWCIADPQSPLRAAIEGLF